MASNFNNIVVNGPDEDEASVQYNREAALVRYITQHVGNWAEHRDNNYKQKWLEYNRLSTGKWDQQDKTRKSERSRLISPATQQAVETSVAEQEEATFGKGKYWIDVDDGIPKDTAEGMLAIRDVLIDDLEEENVPDEIIKAYLYGAIFGTGIGKIIIRKKRKKKVIAEAVQNSFSNITRMGVEETNEVMVGVEAVHPLNFVIDPAARCIDEAKGVAVIYVKPTHQIKKKQAAGIYNDGDLGTFDDDNQVFINDENKNAFNDNYTKIIEYHGLVPRGLLIAPEMDAFETVKQELSESKQEVVEFDEADMVEAIVTISNDSKLLRAVENPLVMQDRGFISFQYDLVPEAFWGRGVPEKGYHPQKALDADLRSRIDALALVSHPMMAMDATKLPRGQRLAVSPGRTLLTNGNPSEVLMPFRFGQLETNSFLQTADLERQIQVGTGSMDTAAPAQVNSRNQTASGMSMISASMLKRQKRTQRNICRQFLKPLIQKVVWRYMQYRPDRYPVNEYNFKPVTAMGLMAREYEQNQLTNLLNIMPKDSPMFGIILKGILQNSSIDTKKDLLESLAQYLTPNPNQQKQQELLQQIQLQNAILQNQKLQSESYKNNAQANSTVHGLTTDVYNAITNRITADTNAKKGANNGK